MGTQAGLDFCNKLAVLNRGKIDQEYPLFILYNKSNIPGRPESIGVQNFKDTKSQGVCQILAWVGADQYLLILHYMWAMCW